MRRDLELLADELAYPPTPRLADAVSRELGSRPGARRRRPLRVALVAAVLVLVLAATAVAASRAVREFLGLQGATVERREKLPPVPSSGDLGLGERVSPAVAGRVAGFRVLIPGRFFIPDEVRLRRETPGGEVSLLYRPRRDLPRSGPTGLGLLVTEFRGDFEPSYLGKIVGQATTTERLRIGGESAIWIEGAPHAFFYRSPGGGFQERPLRLAANVLLIERGPLLVRLEGSFGRDEAVRIAESLR